jgi:hypothetical protein
MRSYSFTAETCFIAVWWSSSCKLDQTWLDDRLWVSTLCTGTESVIVTEVWVGVWLWLEGSWILN